MLIEKNRQSSGRFIQDMYAAHLPKSRVVLARHNFAAYFAYLIRLEIKSEKRPLGDWQTISSTLNTLSIQSTLRADRTNRIIVCFGIQYVTKGVGLSTNCFN